MGSSAVWHLKWDYTKSIPIINIICILMIATEVFKNLDSVCHMASIQPTHWNMLQWHKLLSRMSPHVPQSCNKSFCFVVQGRQRLIIACFRKIMTPEAKNNSYCGKCKHTWGQKQREFLRSKGDATDLWFAFSPRVVWYRQPGQLLLCQSAVAQSCRVLPDPPTTTPSGLPTVDSATAAVSSTAHRIQPFTRRKPRSLP